LTNIEAMKQALEAWDTGLDKRPAMEALRTAIEQAEKQEPVAWVRENELPLAPGDAFSWVETLVHKTPLYTTPPAAQRQWVGLTDEEAMQTWGLVVKYAPSEVRLKSFARLIRDKLKEKNT
jgi:hypothetical protein